jgi:prolipoprotein diacylglyceryltransferase
MFPYLNLFGAAIAVSPLVILVAIWLGAALAERTSDRHGIPSETLYNLIFIALLAFILGGRLSYAAQYPSAFIADPVSLVSRNLGLFDPVGGAAIGLVAAAIYGQRKQLALWPTLDALTPALAVLLTAIPLANLASGEAFGAPSSLPWAIELWGQSRHPVQIYEALAAGLILWWLWPGRAKSQDPAGTNFLLFVAANAFSRLFFEGLRGSSALTVLNLRAAQLAAWVILAAALYGLLYLRRKSKTALRTRSI